MNRKPKIENRKSPDPWADMDAAKAAMEKARIAGHRPALQEVESDEHKDGERIIKRIIHRPVKTLEDLARECQIDLTEWEIHRWKCSAWQTGMKPWRPKKRGQVSGARFQGKEKSESRKPEEEQEKEPGRGIRFEPIYSQQFMVTAWMRPRVEAIRAKLDIEALRKKAEGYAPDYSRFSDLAIQRLGDLKSQNRKIAKSPNGQELLAEYAPMDHHFGVLAWGKETGGANSDLKLQTAGWEKAIMDLIAKARPYGAARALLVLGNDQQNFDNRSGTTTKGTPQDTDVRYQKVFGASFGCSVWAIERLLAAHARVDIVICPGNHDMLSAWHLGHSLAAWFSKCDRVSVDNRPLFRKYYEFGQVMLMFTHGHIGKLESYPSLMSTEQPEMWGRTLWREAHTGDKHQRRLLELRGAAVRILPSLRPPDAWTSENQFIGSVRAAEAFIWHKQMGLQANLIHSVLKNE